MMLEELEKIRKEIREYLGVRFDLLRLQIAENISGILSKTATLIITGYLLFFILLFLSIAAGYFFASLLGSNELGFLCVAGFYTLLLLIFMLFRKRIIERPVIRTVIKLLFPKTGDNEE